MPDMLSKNRYVDIALYAQQTDSNPNSVDKPLQYFENISADFVVQQTRGAEVSRATINIYNLSKENIDFFTTFKNETILGLQKRQIQLFAGYYGTDYGLSKQKACIFSGDIIHALPTMRPDIALECDCYTMFFANQDIKDITMHGPISMQDICREVAKRLGLAFYWKASKNKMIDNFYFNGGGVYNILNLLNDLGGVVVYVEDGALIAADEKEPRKPPILEINKNTGLIGLPRPTMFGVNFTTLLNPALKMGQQIHLLSEAIPSASGYYFVSGATHRGSYRGNTFYTEVQCTTYDI